MPTSATWTVPRLPLRRRIVKAWRVLRNAQPELRIESYGGGGSTYYGGGGGSTYTSPWITPR